MVWLRRRGRWLGGWLGAIHPWQGVSWWTAAELVALTVWVAWVGRAWLDFDPLTWPFGREFGSQVQSHHVWSLARECGLCALWNGGINGGAPALADIFSSAFHPFVAIPTLLWGVVVGTKVALVLSLWTAGLAQWWLARLLGLGWVARLWSAGLAVVGGHLAGRLEVGAVGLVISTAACSLALVAAMEVGLSGRRAATLRLALTGALALIAGQGYLQLALLCWGPALLFLVGDEQFRLRPVWREYVLALGLAALLIGFWLVPAVHFGPQITKFVDTAFKSAQPLEYAPLNLVIRDAAFMRSESLGKLPHQYLYSLYVGWVPVGLAILGLRLARRAEAPLLLSLAAGTLMVFFVASATPLRWLVKFLPALAGFRHPPLIAGLAVPAVLGLAAYSLDRLMGLEWPQVILRLRTGRAFPVSLSWLLVIPLVWAIRSAYEYGRPFLGVSKPQTTYELVESLRTPTRQWVSPPFGEHYWVEPALAQGLKVAPVVWAWRWEGRELPQARLIAARDPVPPGVTVRGNLGDIPIQEYPEREYAYVDTGSQIIACQASGRGGDLVIHCQNDQPGMLVVQENSWSGWQVWRDEERVELDAGQWLSTQAAAGEHTYQFRYRPADVVVGMLLTVVGLVWVIGLWRQETRPGQAAIQDHPERDGSDPPTDTIGNTNVLYVRPIRNDLG